MRRAEARLSGSMQISSSITLSFAGYDADCMRNTSSPRMFSWISTNTSMSEKRRIVASTSGMLRNAAMASASGRLLLPAIIFMEFSLVATSTRSAGHTPGRTPGRRRGGMYQSVC
jgi:hypothetical protein